LYENGTTADGLVEEEDEIYNETKENFIRAFFFISRVHHDSNDDEITGLKFQDERK
jgi:hypothetical protein